MKGKEGRGKYLGGGEAKKKKQERKKGRKESFLVFIFSLTYLAS